MVIGFGWISRAGARKRGRAAATRFGLATVLLASVGTGFIGVGPAVAQDPLQDLIDSAQNVNQRSLAVNITEFCPNLPASPTGDELDLKNRCGAMVGLSSSSAKALALGQISPDKILAQDAVVRGTMQPQTRAVAARLSAIGGRIAGPRLSLSEPVQVASTDPWQVLADNSGMNAFSTSGLGVFLNGSGGFGDKSATSLESGYDFNSYSVTGGVDYSFLDNLTAGVAVGYAGSNVDFDNNGGNIDSNAVVLSTYGLWHPMEALGLSGLLSYGRIYYNSDRHIVYTDPSTIDRHAKGDTSANQFEVSTSANYDFTHGSFTYGPIARMSFVYQDVAGFTETGAQGLDLTYDSRSSQSFQTGLGAAVAYALSTGVGVTTLQARAEWVHEYLDDSEVYGVRYENNNVPNTGGFTLTSDAPDRDRAVVGAGASMVFQQGFSAFTDFETVLALSNVNSYTFTAGLRKEF